MKAGWMKYVLSIVLIRTSRVAKEGKKNTAKAVTCPDAGNFDVSSEGFKEHLQAISFPLIYHINTKPFFDYDSTKKTTSRSRTEHDKIFRINLHKYQKNTLIGYQIINFSYMR